MAEAEILLCRKCVRELTEAIRSVKSNISSRSAAPMCHVAFSLLTWLFEQAMCDIANDRARKLLPA